MNMEENAQNTQQEENPNEPLLPPIIELFREPSIKFFQVMDNFSDKWEPHKQPIPRYKDQTQKSL